MSTTESWKLLVFRDGRRVLDSCELVQGLLQQLQLVQSLNDFTSQFARDELIDALLRAGELECALADEHGCQTEASVLGAVTDGLAAGLVQQSKPALDSDTLRQLNLLALPERLTLSTPEGFCYYALNPLDYVDLFNQSKIEISAAAVVGIRSIGTTLSAVVRAWFAANEIPAARITVRPTGHPFARQLNLAVDQQNWITTQLQRRAQFLIVDEGPGLSGSSFLSVAEALVQAGVLPEHIVLLPSSTPNVSNLLAQNAVARWSRFRTLALKSTSRIPSNAHEFVGGGEWRKHVFASESEWPGVWSWTERQKYLSREGRQILRFDGHGRYGKEVRRRTETLAAHGWGPEARSAGDGFSISPWLEGRRLRKADRNVILQLAHYCAFRAKHLRCDAPPQSELEHMARVNLERGEVPPHNIELRLECPVIADARMMPYEWIISSPGQLLKFDASSHGEDHFYPGPTDIAWDLAGAIVEWKLDRAATALLLEKYMRESGDKVTARLPGYVSAYCAFRLGFTESAKISNPGPIDFKLLERESAAYHNALKAFVSESVTAATR